jgi:hypothetical protein
MFHFLLSESAARARALLQNHVDCTLSSWHRVVAQWRRAKGDLIDALDARTGRFVQPYTHELTDDQRAYSWRNALDSLPRNALSRCEGLYARVETAPDEETRNRARDTWSRAVALHAAALHAENALAALSLSLRDDELSAGKLADNATAGKPGQKLSRALSAALRAVDGITPDQAATLTDLLTETAAVKPRTGELVLSANILDLLTCSELASYRSGSCHSFAGCHRAGPQQYLADDCTIVAYYHEGPKPPAGPPDLPWKLWRSMVYVDADHSSATLQRFYGQSLPQSAVKAVRQMVACLLSALDTGYPLLPPPHWYLCKTDEVFINNPARFAFIDATESVIQLRPGKEFRPQVDLSSSVLCPACGDNLDSANLLVCSSCDGSSCDGDYLSCSRCNSRILEEDCHFVDGHTYCSDCYNELYFCCHSCHEDFSVDDMSVIDDGNVYCQDCFLDLYRYCDFCNRDRPRDDFTTIHSTTIHGNRSTLDYCNDCAHEYSADCEECGERFLNDLLSEFNDLSLCEECANNEATRVLLRGRLQSSPLFLRLPPMQQLDLALVWSTRRAALLSSNAIANASAVQTLFSLRPQPEPVRCNWTSLAE